MLSDFIKDLQDLLDSWGDAEIFFWIDNRSVPLKEIGVSACSEDDATALWFELSEDAPPIC